MGPSPTATILHVDDYAIGRYAVSEILRRHDFVVVEAATGDEALRLVRDQPDLVLLDVNLPDVHGFEVCRRIKADPVTAGIPVLLLSSTATGAQDQVGGLQAGADGYLAASTASAVLVATIQALVRARRAEAALRVSEERFRRLAEHAEDVIHRYEFAPRPGFAYVSPAVIRVVGYTPEEHYADPNLGRRYIHPDDMVLLENLFERGDAPGHIEQRWRHKDGRLVWVEQRNVAVRDAEGTLVAVEGISRDITDRKRAEAERECLLANERAARAEAEEARERLQRFVGMAAHEIGSPLAVVLGYAQLLHKRNEDAGASDEQQMLRSMIEAARKMRRLTDDLRDAARIGAGRFEITPISADLAEIAREVVREAQLLTTTHELIVEAPEHLEGIWDAVRLNQLLANLVSNAIKYSPGGGEVRIAVRRRDGEGRVSISDQGEGMTLEQMGQLFLPFGRLEREHERGITGAGLGLYISKAIAEAHGGRIWAESEPGKGSTFHVMLPLPIATT